MFLTFFFPLAGFILFGTVFLLLRGALISYFTKNSGLVNSYISLVLPLTFFMVYLSVLEIYTSTLLRIVVPKIIRDVVLKSLNILIIVLFYLKVLSLQQFLWGIVGIYAVAAGLNLIYLSTLTRLNLNPGLKNIDKGILKNMITYMLLILLMGIGSNVVNKIDVIMISGYINLTNTGIYSIAFYIIVIIEIPSRSFQQMAGPLVSKSFHENDMNSIREIYSKSSLVQFLVGGIIFLIVWINVDSIFSIMPNGSIYQAGKYVIFFLGLNKLFDLLTGVNVMIVSNSKYYSSLLVFILYLTIVTILTNYFLIPRMGITGAALASLVALSSYNIILIVYLWLKMKIQPFSVKTIWVIIILGLLYMLNGLMPRVTNLWVDIIYRSLALSSLFILIIYRLRISMEINEVIRYVVALLGIRLK